MSASREFRVFLSSTFRDLQPEREQLVKKVFPRLRAAARERGVEFTEIDLRWGITAEESRSGKAVRICLDEIGKCAPYFIGMFGSRYGWSPGFDELVKDEECLERYPWLADLGKQFKSITEMEITYGALRRDSTDSAFFYEQTSRLGEIPEYEREQFDSLKQRIRERGFRYNRFATPEELGEQVYRDLLFLLDRDFPLDHAPTPVELERAPHIAYSINRRRSYVANPEYLERFEAHVESDDVPLIVWGRSGLGKSALMAYLTHEYQKRNPDSFVIMHFIGAAAAGSDPEDVMRQVMMEIKDRYALDDEIPRDDQKIREEFPTWLAKVQNEKLVLAIDALNQLTGVAEELHWLPEFIPSHVRLIVSTTPGHTLEQLRKHKWQELELQPLDVASRERIATEYLLKFNKKLTPEQLREIASNPKCESPLFLRTMLEELRVFGRHTALDEYIAAYLACNDERELFATILARMESDFGEQTVRSVMQMIFASRFGLSHTELLGVTGLSQLALSEFLIALEYHLMQRSGLYTFFHNYLREAVEIRYLADDGSKQNIHSQIGEYFSHRSYSTRRRDEEPWQWQQAGDQERLRACLSDTSMFKILTEEDQRYTFLGYLPSSETPEETEAYFDRVIEADRERSSREEQAVLHYQLGNVLLARSNCLPAAKQFEKARILSQGSSLDNATIFQIYYQLSDALQQKGDIEAARALIDDLMHNPSHGVSPDSKEYIKCLDMLGTFDYALGRYSSAETYLVEALRLRESRTDISAAERSGAYSNLAAILTNLGRNDEAISYIDGALKYIRASYGENHIETAKLLGNQGVIYKRSGKFEEASSFTKKSLEIYRSLIGEFNLETARVIHNLATLSSELGDHEQFFILNKRAYEIRKEILGSLNYDTKVSEFGIARQLQLSGHYEEALSIYKECLMVYRQYVDDSHLQIQRTLLRISECEEALTKP